MTAKSKKPFLKYSFGLQLSLMVLLGVFVTAILSFWTAVPVLESLANLAYDDRQVNLMSEARLRIAELYKLRRDVLESKIHECLKSSTNLNLCSIQFQNHNYSLLRSNDNLKSQGVKDLVNWNTENEMTIVNEVGSWTLKIETPPIKELGNSISEWVSARSHLILVIESLKKSLIVNLAKSIAVGGLVALLIVSLFSKSTRRRFSELRRFIRTLSLGGQQDIPAQLLGNDDFSVLASDVHSLSKSLAEAQKKLIDVERMNLWQNMARKVAHEIKNPMTPMSLVGEQLKLISSSIGDPKLNHIISESGRIICEETASLNRMVKEFTAFARLPKPQMERAKMSVLIKDFINRNINQSSFIAEFKSSTDDQEIYCDPAMIRQIFHNILNNAVNACEPNIVKVSFILSLSEKSLVLDIKDDGPGVPESLRETLFNAYVTSRSTGDKSKGMGLGLTICRQIAQDHGGQIELYSTGNHGTTLRLTLPLIPLVERTE